MEMMDLLGFCIKSDYIAVGNSRYYFFRIKPPNFTILDVSDRERYRADFENIMRNIEDREINIFAMDKTVNLDANRNYINSFNEEFDFIKTDLEREFSSLESDNGKTERAYFFVVKAKDKKEMEYIEQIIRLNNFNIHIAQSNELISVMRCFLLREFIDADIYIGEETDG